MKFNKICILGLGYIGLPTASMFAVHRVKVIGVDVNRHVVETLNRGETHIKEPGLDEVLKRAIDSGHLTVQQIPEPADAFIIAVPTPIQTDKTADMRMVTSAARMIVPVLKRGNLVILESTSPPRTTVDLLQPILETSGLKAGEDFLLAYSPERVLPGQILREIVENARVIGGIDSASAEAGRDLYGRFVRGDILLTDATTAEMVKLMENTFRDVNIALANEFALIAERSGVNVWEAIEMANRHPRVKILKPGPGVGGHCIAIDPWFLVESAPNETSLIRQAREVNDNMPAHVVALVESAMDATGARDTFHIAVLGLAYKANVDDFRESPAVEVVHKLIQEGFNVRLNDVMLDPQATVAQFGVPLYSIEDAVAGADCMLVLTDHDAYKRLVPKSIGALMRRKLLIDTRNSLNLTDWETEAFEVIVLGKGENSNRSLA